MVSKNVIVDILQYTDAGFTKGSTIILRFSAILGSSATPTNVQCSRIVTERVGVDGVIGGQVWCQHPR